MSAPTFEELEQDDDILLYTHTKSRPDLKNTTYRRPLKPYTKRQQYILGVTQYLKIHRASEFLRPIKQFPNDPNGKKREGAIRRNAQLKSHDGPDDMVWNSEALYKEAKALLGKASVSDPTLLRKTVTINGVKVDYDANTKKRLKTLDKNREERVRVSLARKQEKQEKDDDKVLESIKAPKGKRVPNQAQLDGLAKGRLIRAAKYSKNPETRAEALAALSIEDRERVLESMKPEQIAIDREKAKAKRSANAAKKQAAGGRVYKRAAKGKAKAKPKKSQSAKLADEVVAAKPVKLNIVKRQPVRKLVVVG